MTLCDRATLHPGPCRFLRLALPALLTGIQGLRAQEPQSFSTIPVTLGPESRNVFRIDANEAITFSLQANRRDLRLVFQDPKGMAWEIVAPSADTGQTSPLTVYATTIKEPVPGAWTLSVLASEPLTDHPGARLRIDYANRVRARMSIPKQTFVCGESLPISLELMDGINRLKDLRTTVAVTKLDEPAAVPTFVIFHDDGAHGDWIARDGMYTATIPAETPGRFQLEAQIEGTGSTGSCHRSFVLIFKVVVKAARITGNISQRILVGLPE